MGNYCIILLRLLTSSHQEAGTTAVKIKLTDKCSFITSQISPQLQVPHSDKVSQSEVQVIDDDDSNQSKSPVPAADRWIMIDKTVLYQKDKEVLLNGKWLNDAYIACAQQLIKQQFPKVSGLQLTLLQQSAQPLGAHSLQILHNY